MADQIVVRGARQHNLRFAKLRDEATDLRFEYAARLRDEIKDLKRELRDVG